MSAAPASPYIRREKLGSEQWIGAGKIVYLVVDEAHAPLGANGIVHQTAWGPLRQLRCRLWARFHGYGWLTVK